MIRRVRPYTWSLVDQGASSVTNLGLSVVAARTLGPAGLGATLMGFAAYLLVLGVQRALLSEPLVTSSTRATASERDVATRAAITCSLALAGGLTAALLVAGLTIPGPAGRGTLVFAPWLAVAMLQDLYRFVLFRDGRPAAAALTDVVWMVASAGAAPLAWLTPSIWVPSLCWGVGAVLGALTGAAVMPLWPGAPRAALRWFRHTAWLFGRWLVAESAAYNVGSYALVWVLALMVGTGSYGGLRATQSIFAPLSLLIPFVAMPGLPAVSRALGVSFEAARRLAARLTVALVALTTAYVLVVGTWPSLLAFVFGKDFHQFANLVWPVGFAQVVAASTGALGLLLKAQQRGAALVVLRLLGSASLVAFSIPLAYAWGVRGAAWASVAGAAAFSVATVVATSPLRFGGVAAPATRGSQ